MLAISCWPCFLFPREPSACDSSISRHRFVQQLLEGEPISCIAYLGLPLIQGIEMFFLEEYPICLNVCRCQLWRCEWPESDPSQRSQPANWLSFCWISSFPQAPKEVRIVIANNQINFLALRHWMERNLPEVIPLVFVSVPVCGPEIACGIFHRAYYQWKSTLLV